MDNHNPKTVHIDELARIEQDRGPWQKRMDEESKARDYAVDDELFSARIPGNDVPNRPGFVIRCKGKNLVTTLADIVNAYNNDNHDAAAVYEALGLQGNHRERRHEYRARDGRSGQNARAGRCDRRADD